MSVDDIRARRAAITPGVWRVELRESSYYYGVFYNATVTTDDSDIAGLGAEEQCHADAAFIAAAPADIDALLRMVDALTGERDAARRERDDWHAELREALETVDVTVAALRECQRRDAEHRRERDALAAQLAAIAALPPSGSVLLHRDGKAVRVAGRDEATTLVLTGWMPQE